MGRLVPQCGKAQTMKSQSPLVNIVCGLALVALAAGCAASREQTESLLSEAGFKTRMATTPEQQEQLKTLLPGKVSVLNRKGQTYFVYPDSDQNLLYFGRDAQFRAYQELRVSSGLGEEKLEGAELNANEGSAWAVWGGMGPWAGW